MNRRLLRDRVEAQRSHTRLSFEKGMSDCTPEERWQREDTYAVKKKKNVRALKVFDCLEDAENFPKDKGDEYEYLMKHYPHVLAGPQSKRHIDV